MMLHFLLTLRSIICEHHRGVPHTEEQGSMNGKRCLFSLLPETQHLELHVLAGFPLLLNPCRCLLRLQDPEDLLLLLHLLPKWREPAKLHCHLTQLHSEEQRCRMRRIWMEDRVKGAGCWCSLSTVAEVKLGFEAQYRFCSKGAIFSVGEKNQNS